MRILVLLAVATLAACTSAQPEQPGTNAASLTLSSTTAPAPGTAPTTAAPPPAQ